MATTAQIEAIQFATADDLKRHARGALALDVSAGTDGYEDAVEAIAEATSVLADYLERDLFVQPATIRPTWGMNPKAIDAAGYPISATINGTTFDELRTRSAHVDAWPIVDPDDARVKLGKVRPDGQEVYADVDVEAFTAFAGYRPQRYTLADLQGLENDLQANGLVALDALATLPPALPYTLRGVILDLAYIAADQRETRTLAGRRETTESANSTFVSEGYRRSAREEILERADDYRNPSL